MSQDDDIDRLLREVEAATSGGAPKPSPSPSAALPAARSGSAEVAKHESGPSAVTHLLLAGAAGGIVAFLVFGIVPFVNKFGILSLAMAGFVGGAVGYGTTRFLLRGKGD